MTHTIIATIAAIAFGILAVGIEPPTNRHDRFTRTLTAQDNACQPANMNGQTILVCTEVYRVR